jgi:Sigma-70 region 2
VGEGWSRGTAGGMSSFSGAPSRAEAEADAVVAAARAGDESAFSLLVESYRRELQVHCYRMVGSYEDAEDMVQETYLRAWRSRSSFEGRFVVSCMALPNRDERLPRPAEAAPAAGAPTASGRGRRPSGPTVAHGRPAVAAAIPGSALGAGRRG